MRYIVLVITSAAIIALNLLYGSTISWFLSGTIILCLLFYVLKIGLENIINKRIAPLRKDDPKIGKLVAFNLKWKSILNFFLLTGVFAGAVLCVYLTQMPVGNKAWYFNNEYHTVSHKGIAFKNQLDLSYKNPDTEDDNPGILRISGISNSGATLSFDNFFSPVIAPVSKNKNELLNPVFPFNITRDFSLRNTDNEISISIEPHHVSLLEKIFTDKSPHNIYRIFLSCKDKEILEQFNLQAPFTDSVSIESYSLKNGMSLYNLFLNSRRFKATKNETYQVLEALLLEMGNTYLLVNEHSKAGTSYNFFPSRAFIDNAYGLYVNNNKVNAQLSSKARLAFNQDFYIGFNNIKKKLHLEFINLADYGEEKFVTNALIFDYPNAYPLSSPGEQEKGDKNVRFITNDFDNLLNNESKEALYFTTYNLQSNVIVKGNLEFYAGSPGQKLSPAVTDFNRYKAEEKTVTGNAFTLQSSLPAIKYLFTIRDFSDNAFTAYKNTIYLCCIYFAFAVVLLLFPGKRIERLEPVILSVVLSLVTLRFIMLWRIATFPPLENISKHELENTLIGFDIVQLGSWAVPLTLIWALLFALALVLLRSISFGELRKNSLFRRFTNLASNSALVKSYAIFLVACWAVYFTNRHLFHIDAFTRIISIFVPLIGYIIYSIKSNSLYQYPPMRIEGMKSNIAIQAKAYLYYIIHNPTSVISLLTVLYFSLCDRGFAVLFILFLILKNILVNFLKKAFDNQKTTLGKMLYRPNNYWIYGLAALVVYLVVLSFKSLFYFALLYKLEVFYLALVFALVVYILKPRNKAYKLAGISILILYTLILSIPYSRDKLNHKLDDIVKHVQYRAALIHHPISSLILQNDFSSFKTRKIIETAENQWFINTYISKDFDPGKTINLQAHSRVGVDYPTQTRDVVVARYIISEMGDFTMYLILFLIVLPMLLYSMSYRIHLAPNKDNVRDIASYSGLIPLIMLFTLALFVWLTSTNRFVFFGQDFPFLSITSRLSVVLPLVLLAITLLQQPTLQVSYKINIQNNAIKYALFLGLIAVFALSTIQQNELNNKNFNISLEQTRDYIEKDLNVILDKIQDSLESKRKPIQYTNLINALAKDNDFDTLYNHIIQDPYSKSILTNLIKKPSTSFQLNNPLYIVYDNGRYQAVYNQNLYLEMPPVENRKLWHGDIRELGYSNKNNASLVFTYNKSNNKVNKYTELPFYSNDPADRIQIAFIPGSWLGTGQAHKGIININNDARLNTQIYFYKNAERNMRQKSTSFASSLNANDVAHIYNSKNTFKIYFSEDGNVFAGNKWVNGKYRIFYPERENNFWVYNFSNSIKSAYSNDSLSGKNVKITLDYDLVLNAAKEIQKTSVNISRKNRRYNFSVIAADGDGNIHLMNDYVSNRKIIDPNDEALIYALQQKHFFFSNAKNERDQWGNRNLLALYLGPGSSIKPLFAGLVASQVNAGWQHLEMYSTQVPELSNYAGLTLVKPWKNDEHYSGIVGLSKYIEYSSNYYQSVVAFLGSYTKSDFAVNANTYSLGKVLATSAGANNSFPVLAFNGDIRYLPNYAKRSGNWPSTDKAKINKAYFGNDNSLIANGFEYNANLITKDKNKTDGLLRSNDRVNFVDSFLYAKQRANGAFLWSFPEQSAFLQSERSFNEIQQNFNLGIKTVALGGYPYEVTPFKMLEMYLSLFTQNNNLHLRITPHETERKNWQVDETWQGNSFKTFLANYIFKGMNDVIHGSNGTAKVLSEFKAKNPQYYFYAKTGTINEQKSELKNSRRLVVIIADKDLTKAEHIGTAKVYGLYFAVDNTGNFDWPMVKSIIQHTINSASFTYYFKQKDGHE